MAEMREENDASTWLQLRADDHSVSDLDKGVLDQLESHYGKDALPDIIEDKLRGDAGADFATATDEQIYQAVNGLADSDQADSGSEGDTDPGLPSEDEMMRLIVSAVLDDSEFRAALEGQFRPVDVPEGMESAAVDELVTFIAESLWEGLEEVMSEFGDNQPAGTPTDAEMDAALDEIRH
jgi:hypothetical protein